MAGMPPTNPTNPTGRNPAEQPALSEVAGGPRPFWGEPSRRLDDWLAIEPDGTVIVYSGKVELGTGVRTALAQIVAEELDVPLARIQMVMGETGRTPDEGYTAGSKTIETSGMILRRAAATARAALLEMAASELNTTPDELTVRDGVITLRDQPGPRVSYAGLTGGRALRPRHRRHRPAQAARGLPPRRDLRAPAGPAREVHRPALVRPGPAAAGHAACAARAPAAPRRDAAEPGRQRHRRRARRAAGRLRRPWWRSARKWRSARRATCA